MILKFNNQKQKDILICVVDNSKNCLSDKARDVLKNLTDYFIQNSVKNYFDVWISDSEDLLLNEASNDASYKYAVIVASGINLGFNKRLFNEIESFCKNDFSIAGHILDRKENYYELHHQFYIVNCKDYRDLGFPTVGVESNDKHTQIIPNRSFDSVHDDYVPTWIEQGITHKEYAKKMHGWNIISIFLNNNKKIIDIGSKIRSCKSYLYYEHDHVFIKSLPELKYQQFYLSSLCVSPDNTDGFIDTKNFMGPVTQYITVGTGYHWIQNLVNLEYTKNTKVIFTDYNQNILNFMKTLIREWNGEDYVDFYREYIKTNHQDFFEKTNELFFQSANQKWIKFRQKVNNWNYHWNQIKSLSYQYKLINYLGLYDLSFVDKNQNTIFNVSNIFNFTGNAFDHSIKYRIDRENFLIENLKKIDQNIFLIFTERSSDMFSKHELTYSDYVKNYKPININELRKVPWHNEDWNNPYY